MADGSTKGRRLDDHARKVANALIEQLKAGTAPWQKPWEPGHDRHAPFNPNTGKDYRGGNAVYLWAEGIRQGYTDPRWMTYRQAAAAGAQVRKGEHGTPIEYWIREGRSKIKDADGNPIKGADGKAVTQDVKFQQPRVMHFTVFNASQIDGLPAAKPRDVPHEWERQARAEAILSASGAQITHGGNRAFYSPTSDSITLPEREQFTSADRYYATALHELGHWTGHADRLNRDLSGGFGSELYAREELRAEISSMIVGDRLGVGHDPGQHAAYVQSWIKTLQDDPREIFRAARDAEQISDYVMRFDPEHLREQEHEEAQPEPTAEDEARWRADEWKIDPDLHRSPVPELGEPAGELHDTTTPDLDDDGMDMG